METSRDPEKKRGEKRRGNKIGVEYYGEEHDTGSMKESVFRPEWITQVESLATGNHRLQLTERDNEASKVNEKKSTKFVLSFRSGTLELVFVDGTQPVT